MGSRHRRRLPARDISLNDYANAKLVHPNGKQRTPKASVSSDNLKAHAEDPVPEDWFSEDPSTYDNAFQTSSHPLRPSDYDGSSSYCYYPYEVWEHIADHVLPEDVSRFSAICRTTYAIVNTAKFWFKLYRDFYRPTRSLPERLTPDCMTRLMSLKSCVIKTLFHVYPPFVDRNRKYGPTAHNRIPQHPSCLIKSVCASTWHRRGSRRQWYFFIKFQKLRASEPLLWQKMWNVSQDEPDWPAFKHLDDIHYNPDNQCSILQVSSLSSYVMPVVIGLKLLEANVTVSGEGFRYHKVILRFVPLHKNHHCNGDDVTEVVFDNVHYIQILPWFHPEFQKTEERDNLKLLDGDLR